MTVRLGGRGRRREVGCFERDGLVGFEMTQQGRGEVLQRERGEGARENERERESRQGLRARQL